MWPLRPARRTVGVAVAMIVAMPLILIVGLGVMALTGAVTLDLTDFSGFAQALQTGVPAGIELPPVQLLVALQLASIPLAAVINAPFAFGEEVGWRGWLLPALRPLGTWPALLVSGAFWGLWHAPLILLGYNFAEPNPLGVVLMIVACSLFGVILGWSRLRTASVWPAVFAHGAFNASAGVGVLLVAADSPVPSAAIAGPLGAVTWVVFALAIGVLLVSGQFRGDRLQAELRPDPVRPVVAPVSG